jgi:hypothetical protein
MTLSFRKHVAQIALVGLCALTLAAAGRASAQTYQCTLNVNFLFGGSAAGTFDFNDSASQTVTNWDITSTGSSVFSIPGFTFQPSDSTATGGLSGFGFQGSTDSQYNLDISNALITGPGTYDVTGQLYSADIGQPNEAAVQVTDGTLKVAAVPEASSIISFGLLVSAGGLLAFRRRYSSRLAA